MSDAVVAVCESLKAQYVYVYEKYLVGNDKSNWCRNVHTKMHAMFR